MSTHGWKQIHCYDDYYVIGIEPIMTVVCKWQCDNCGKKIVIPESHGTPETGTCDHAEAKKWRAKKRQDIARMNSQDQKFGNVVPKRRER